MISIISFVKNREILPVLDRLVNKEEGWEGVRAADLETAREHLRNGRFDVILLGAGTGDEERAELRKVIDETEQQTIMIDHYGGGSGLLYAEVMEALNKAAD